jgi:hypothetical protein
MRELPPVRADFDLPDFAINRRVCFRIADLDSVQQRYSAARLADSLERHG